MEEGKCARNGDETGHYGRARDHGGTMRNQCTRKNIPSCISGVDGRVEYQCAPRPTIASYPNRRPAPRLAPSFF